ncbi:MAG TPA: cbb3-type cytochrome c oxidase subunit I [Ktedonobacterales bacterium]|nr:cbb3-type cytochrome c oxidase subunit I [Ktedonobacterales bacterium]
MKKLFPSYLSGAILAVIGFIVGQSYVYHFVGSGNTPKGPNFTEQGLVLGFIGLLVGWLIGIGAFKYPITWMLGLKDPDHEEELRLAGANTGVSRYFRFTTDHKVVGIQYLVATLIMLAFGGLGAMLIRIELIRPGAKAFPPGTYNTVVTMHGMLMILTTITFFIGPFGNFIVPIMIGARDMAFPRLNALSFALLVPGVVIFAFIPFLGYGQGSAAGGGAQTGWTVLGAIADEGGVGVTALVCAVIILGASSMLGAVNLITTVIKMRAPGMRWTRLPMTVWGIFGAALLAAIGTSSFTVDLLLILMDRIYKTTFFVASTGGNAIVNAIPNTNFGFGGGSAWLSQNLFWFFGHPEVYLIVLPAFGIALDVLTTFSRKTVYGYKMAVIGIMGVVVLSFLVWAHHEFVSGWAPEIRGVYMATTEMISVPTGFIFLVLLGTLWRGKLWVTVPSLFALSFIWNFLIGGLTGIYLSDVPADVQLHGGMFVTAHFHYTIVGGALMGFFAAVYFWFPKMTGRMMDERIGWISFWGIQIGFNVAFMAMFIAGLQGMPRRVADYDPIFANANLVTSLGAFLLAASIVLTFYNIVYSWVAGEKAVANPWGAKTLEWLVPTPVPLENFEEIPVVTGHPYDYGESEHMIPIAEAPGGQFAG